jgi:hypothetical protein
MCHCVVAFHANPLAVTGFVPSATVPFNVAVVVVTLVAATVVTVGGVTTGANVVNVISAPYVVSLPTTAKALYVYPVFAVKPVKAYVIVVVPVATTFAYVPFVVAFHANPLAVTGFVPCATVPFNVAVVVVILVAATVVTVGGVTTVVGNVVKVISVPYVVSVPTTAKALYV